MSEQTIQAHMGPTRQRIKHDDTGMTQSGMTQSTEDPGELLNYTGHACLGRDAMVQAVMSKVTNWFGGYYPKWQYRPHDDPNVEGCDFELETCCFIEEAWVETNDAVVEVIAPDAENQQDMMMVNFKTLRCGVLSIRRQLSPPICKCCPFVKGRLPIVQVEFAAGVRWLDEFGEPHKIVNDCPERDAILKNVVTRVTSWFNGDYPVWEYAHRDAWIPFAKETCCFIEAGWTDLSASAYQILVPDAHDDNDMMWINLNTMRSGVVPIRRRTTLVPGNGRVVRFESFWEEEDGSIANVNPIEDPYFLAQLKTLAMHKGRTQAYVWTEMGWFDVIKHGNGCALCAYNAPRMRAKRLECQTWAWLRPDAATVLCRGNCAPAA